LKLAWEFQDSLATLTKKKKKKKKKITHAHTRTHTYRATRTNKNGSVMMGEETGFVRFSLCQKI
jgi:hypothetical protein